MKNNITISNLNKKWKWIICIVAMCTILISVLPMNINPIWNGKIPQHRNQYELLTNSMLKGHLYIDYGKVDQKLLDMKNPYDPVERKKQKVDFHWDHAFYKGHYYMYFGVAPVFLTFMPYKLITGRSLTTYHATQLYVTGFIIGVFALLYLLCKLFYSKTKPILYLLSCVSLSIMCIWYSVGAPALYCTAITAGLCMAIWSIYFFLQASYGKHSENKSIVYAFFGSLFGALTFACRPPIALVNFLVIPLFIHFLKEHKLNKKLIGKLFLAVLPYIIIGILLMLYNYLRFDSPFEFGQSYQLTSADQQQYANMLSSLDLSNLLTNLRLNFFYCGEYFSNFPFVNISGAFLNYPILFLPIVMLADEKFRKKLVENKIMLFYIILLLLPLLVTVVDSLWAPWLTERYRMDIYYLMAISTFISIINYYTVLNNKNKKIFTWIISILLVLTLIKSVLLFFVPNDSNLTSYYPEILEKIGKIFKLSR